MFCVDYLFIPWRIFSTAFLYMCNPFVFVVTVSHNPIVSLLFCTFAVQLGYSLGLLSYMCFFILISHAHYVHIVVCRNNSVSWKWFDGKESRILYDNLPIGREKKALLCSDNSEKFFHLLAHSNFFIHGYYHDNILYQYWIKEIWLCCRMKSLDYWSLDVEVEQNWLYTERRATCNILEIDAARFRKLIGYLEKMQPL